MGPRAATIAKVAELEAQRRKMHLVNRYIAAHRLDMLPELGIPRAEAARLVRVGGYTSAEITAMREAIRYYRNKSKRRLWLPDPGERA